MDLAWWVTWSIPPTGTNVEGVPVRALNQNWRRVSLIRTADLPAASRQAGERPEDHDAVFSVDIDLDGDAHDERAVVGVYETVSGEIGRLLLILGRVSAEKPWTKKAVFSLKDAEPFSAIVVQQGDNVATLWADLKDRVKIYLRSRSVARATLRMFLSP